jgi:hypothetical protein
LRHPVEPAEDGGGVLNDLGVVGEPNRGKHELHRILEFLPVGEFRRFEHHQQYADDITVGGAENLRHALHQWLGRSVGHEIGRELSAHMGRGRRVTGNDVECLFDLRKATPFDGVAEQVLDAIVVPGRIELEQAVADVIGLRHIGLWRVGVLRLEIDADAGENASKLLHILLGVAGADPHGVQLHDLAGVVLVDVTLGVLGVVEIAQHGRMRGGDAQEVSEFAECVATQLLLIVADGLSDVRLVEMHVEMVEPEPRHLLAQLIG